MRVETGQVKPGTGHQVEVCGPPLCQRELLTEFGTGFLKPTLSS